MTIDITIGKLKVKSFKKVLSEQLDNEYAYTYKSTFNLVDFLEVKQCPDEPDGCTSDDTMCPNSAYRSGSIGGLCDFFRKVMPDLIHELRPIDSNDSQITRIKPFLECINKLKYEGEDNQHKIRLHWLKFWCNRAVELYGNDAVIQFS